MLTIVLSMTTFIFFSNYDEEQIKSRKADVAANKAAQDLRTQHSDLIRALRRGSSDSLNRTGQKIVQRNLDIQPTLTIRPGFPVRVIVNRDLVLEPYQG